MHSRSLLLACSFVVLACSSPTSPAPSRDREVAAADSSPAPVQRPERPRRPEPGERAPQLDLESLAGGRVTLPAMSKADRAAVLIFGSFS